MVPMPDFVGSFGPWIGGLLVLVWLALNTALVWRQRGKARQDVARLDAADGKLDREKASSSYVEALERRILRAEEQAETALAALARCEEAREAQVVQIRSLRVERHGLISEIHELRKAAE